MGTSYPGGTDSFNEPSLPEETTLSEAGSASRNHTEHHRDLGDAIEAIEAHASQKTHNHDGTDSPTGGPKLTQANTHESVDTDASTSAIHHTIGKGAHQAAAGDHVHDYNSSEIVNKPLFICTSTTRPENPKLGTMIWETDKNCFRVWSQFSPNNVANVGVYATDDFERTDATGLGADWEQTYYPDATDKGYSLTEGGVMAIPDGHNVRWVPPAGFTWPKANWPWPYVQGRCVARRVKSADKHTVTDDQAMTWQAGSNVVPFNSLWPPTPTTNDFYLRMSDDGQSYIRVSYTYAPGVLFVLWLIILIFIIPLTAPRASILVYYTDSGPEGEKLLGTLAISDFDPFTTYDMQVQGRTLSFYADSHYVGQIVDKDEVTAMGPDNRGWGFGMTVGRGQSGGVSYPTYVNQLWMNDMAYYTGAPTWQILPVGSVPVMKVLQSQRQKLDHAGSLIEWSTVEEDPFNFFNPASSKTDIVIKEPGIYNVSAAIQWDQQLVPDVVSVVILLNGVQTKLRQQQFLRGAAYTPGFSQTVQVKGQMRFAANDRLQIRCDYTASGGLLNLIWTYADAASDIMSRLELEFISP